MKRKFISAVIAATVVFSQIPMLNFSYVSAADNLTRQMEYLDRGTTAAVTSGGVYLSWRLLGTESLDNQAFDIYRDGKLIYTTGEHDATCYTDKSGTKNNRYTVVKSGYGIDGEKTVSPWTTNVEYKSNSVAYLDIPFTPPEGGITPDDGKEYKDKNGNTQTIDGNYTYSANDMSVGDLDGDGEYELIVKWDPSNSKDNSNVFCTGEVYIDAYKLDGTMLWRMDLGCNIRAGAHYTQYIVYDFDGDGKSEIAFKTAPGSKDGTGHFVSLAGKSASIKEADNTKDYRNDSGLILTGPEWLTVFEGETGKALQTVDYDPPRSIKNVTNNEWGDTYGNRCERYLAGVAYLDGKTPSLIMTRGYYTYAYAAAYKWDGENLTEQWLSSNEKTSCTVKYADGTEKTQDGKTLYGQGCHSLSVADVDNDGYDEIIFGSAVLDNDGTVLQYNGRGHGDAEHVSDFDNDGMQEIFQVHEAGKGSEDTIPYAVDIRRYNGDVMLQAAKGDIGRGVMANIDDEYAVSSGNLSAFWSTADGANIYNQKGVSIGKIPYSNSNYENMFVYWDGDLGRELLDGTKLAKHSISNNSTERIYYNSRNSTFPDVASINGSKSNPGLSADILGDWREEIVYPLGDNTGARIYFSTIPTDYRLTTLMHDSQYRCAVAWQNVAYNQPPHQSYYIGSAALAKDAGGNTLNYLAPAVEFDKIEYASAPAEKTPIPSTPTPVPTASPVPTPANILAPVYESDNSTADGWSGNTVEFNNDTAAVELSGSGSGNRSHMFTFPSEVTNITDGKMQVSFDFKFSDNIGNKAVAQIALLDSDNSVKSNNNGVVTDNIIWGLKSPTWSSTRNDSYSSSDAPNTSFDITKGIWYTFTAVIDYDSNTMSVSLTDPDNKTIYSAENVTVSGKGLKNIYVLSPRYDTGTRKTCIKNIAVSTIENVTIKNISHTHGDITVIKGEDLDLSKLEVYVNYSNGESYKIPYEYFNVSGYDKNKLGQQTVTVNYKGFTDSFTVNVKNKTISSINLTPPAKTSYIQGETLNTDGMKVSVQYNDNTTEEIDVSECTVSGYDMEKAGKQTVTVKYSDFTASFEITVKSKTAVGIVIDAKPTKLLYTKGEDLNTNGIKISLKYEDNTTENINVSECIFSGYDKNVVGEQIITVKYNDFTSSFKVTVSNKTAIGIAINAKPAKLSYKKGENLDLDGIEVSVKFSDGSSEIISDYNVSGYSSDTVGTKTIKIEYNGFIAAFTVEIIEDVLPDTVEKPTFKITSIVGGKKVELSSNTPNAKIYYTIGNDNSEPVLYSEPIEISETSLIKAYAVKDGMNNSVPSSVTISVLKAASPTASHNSGELIANTIITLKSETSGSTIYYTTDGTQPTAESEKYSGSIVVYKDMTIKAISVKDGFLISDIFEAKYSVKNTQSPVSVSVGSVTASAGDLVSVPIYYIFDGNISDCELEISYDDNIFEYDSITPAEGVKLLSSSPQDGKITLNIGGIQSGEICTVNLKAAASAVDGEYIINAVDNKRDAEVIKGTVTLENSINSNLEKVDAVFTVTDKNGNTITKDSIVDKIDTSVIINDVKNTQNENNAIIANIIIAVYDTNGALAAFNIMEADLSQTNNVYSSSISIPDGVHVGTIKTMIWNSLYDMSPIMKSNSIL